MQKFAVILAAAGNSSRFKDKHYKKPFIRLGSKAVWLHSAERFLNRPDVCQVILVIAQQDREQFLTLFGPNIAIMGIDVVNGGKERFHSVGNALGQVSDQASLVAIHDAARPCISDADIDSVFQAGKQNGAAILATPVTSTIKSASNEMVQKTVPRDGLWLAQTPQVFDKAMLENAFSNLGSATPTDEAELVENAGHTVSIVPGSPLNIKITTRADLDLAKAIVNSQPTPKPGSPFVPFADDELWR